MLKDLTASIRLAGITIVICAAVYPLTILAFAAVAAPEGRLGSLVTDSQGRVVGSRVIAQSFSRAEYFWPRPSACDFNASAAAGSNLSPANPAVRSRAEGIVERLAATNDQPLPPDLLTASGSGIDPHISLAAAQFQAPRIAKARGMSENSIQRLIEALAEQMPLSDADDPKLINVLELNLALDASVRTP